MNGCSRSFANSLGAVLCAVFPSAALLPQNSPSNAAVAGAALAITVQPAGLPPMTLAVSNGLALKLDASDDLKAWAPVRPVFEAEVVTNAFSEVISPLAVHYVTNIYNVTNYVRTWDGYRWIDIANTNPVTEITTVVDSWETNAYPHLGWRVPRRESTNVPVLFLRLMPAP